MDFTLIIVALIQGAFTLMQMEGKTPEEMDAMYEAVKTKFLENKPELLPDPT